MPEATQQQKLAWEKELLGIYLSEHPFARAAEELRGVLTCAVVEVNAEFAGRDMIIGGVVAGIRPLSTQDGRQFLAAEIEDMTGSIEVTVWPETYEQTRDLWQHGNIVIVNVRVKARDDRLQLSVQKAALYGDPAFDLQRAPGEQRRLERQRLSPQRQRRRALEGHPAAGVRRIKRRFRTPHHPRRDR